jgi:stage V sporulation protein SpoVS
MKVLLFFAGSIFIFGIIGCARLGPVSTSIKQDDFIRKPVFPSKVAITTQVPPPAEYRKIGEVILNNISRDILDAVLRERAASQGGDLVYIPGWKDIQAEFTAAEEIKLRELKAYIYIQRAVTDRENNILK